MDTLNSQRLTYLDGYLHAFRQPGKYSYRVLILPAGHEGSEPQQAYSVQVVPDGAEAGKGRQHDVILRWNPDRRLYQPEPAELSLGVNDFAIWRVATNTAVIPSYSIRGELEGKPVFDSRALAQHDVFTHFFMTAGEYAYRISGMVTGHISVRDHRKVETAEYERQSKQSVVVQIVHNRPEPDKLGIVAGQTVVWVVGEGSDVTIATEAGGRGTHGGGHKKSE